MNKPMSPEEIERRKFEAQKIIEVGKLGHVQNTEDRKALYALIQYSLQLLFVINGGALLLIATLVGSKGVADTPAIFAKYVSVILPASLWFIGGMAFGLIAVIATYANYRCIMALSYDFGDVWEWINHKKPAQSEIARAWVSRTANIGVLAATCSTIAFGIGCIAIYSALLKVTATAP